MLQQRGHQSIWGMTMKTCLLLPLKKTERKCFYICNQLLTFTLYSENSVGCKLSTAISYIPALLIKGSIVI